MHPHRLHVVQSIEALVQSLFVYQYLGDTSTLLFVSRSIFHLHCVNLREWHATRGIPFFAAFLAFNLVHALTKHIWSTPGKTLILDFIGQTHKPSHLHFVLLDFAIFVLQLLTVVLMWETGHRDDTQPDPLEFVEQSAMSDDLESSPLPESKESLSRPIFTLRSKHIWRRLSTAEAARSGPLIPTHSQ